MTEDSVSPFNPRGIKILRNVHGKPIGLDWESTRPAVVVEEEAADDSESD